MLQNTAFNDGTRPGDSAEIVYEFASVLWVNKVDAYGSNETAAKSKSAILYVGNADGGVSQPSRAARHQLDSSWRRVVFRA